MLFKMRYTQIQNTSPKTVSTYVQVDIFAMPNRISCKKTENI